MAADLEGNDLSKVNVPITGYVAVQLTGTPLLLKQSDIVDGKVKLPSDYTKLGLITEDGGPEDGAEDGDSTKFFQDGYEIAGDSSMTMKAALAEANDTVIELTTGHKPDANGRIVVDRNVPDTTFGLVSFVKYKNGAVKIRSGVAGVSAVERGKEERGKVVPAAVTFKWRRNEEIDGYFQEWTIHPKESATSPAPTSPAGTNTP